MKGKKLETYKSGQSLIGKKVVAAGVSGFKSVRPLNLDLELNGDERKSAVLNKVSSIEVIPSSHNVLNQS